MVTENGTSFHAERTDTELLFRLPNPTRLLRAFLPDDAVKHLYAAQREQLLALRSMIDAAITRIEAAEREGGANLPRRTEIRVD